jgi:hypothetical protein
LAAICVLAGFVSGLSTDVVRIPIKADGAGPLFQIRRGVEWGYMNRKGRVVIRPRFQNEGDFFEGLAKVEVGGNWGYIDEKGRYAITPVFQDAGDFHEGLAPVQVNRTWGFVDRAGKVVISPQFQGAGRFSGGLARIELWDRVDCGGGGSAAEFYTKDNAPLYAYQLGGINAHTACAPRGAGFGYIDQRGRVVIPPSFPVAQDFSEGAALVGFAWSFAGFGFIDTTGKEISPARFGSASSFSEGLAAVETLPDTSGGGNERGRWGYIAHDGTYAIKPQFADAHPFSKGLAEASTGPGKWGYIDKRGTFVIDPRYEETTQFSDGLALVLNDEGESWYIDKAGRIALRLPPSLSPSWPFSDGLTVARVVGEQEQRYVDHRGRIIADYGP